LALLIAIMEAKDSLGTSNSDRGVRRACCPKNRSAKIRKIGKNKFRSASFQRCRGCLFTF
jgi:hypothetical protein